MDIDSLPIEITKSPAFGPPNQTKKSESTFRCAAHQTNR